MLGRGSTDMKGGVACAMVSFAFASAVEKVGGSLTLALVCDEESSGEYELAS